MIRQIVASGLVAAVVLAVSFCGATSVEAAPPGQPTNWGRFYHYPYVYYPHNYQPAQQSNDHLYYRYPQSRQIPVYNKDWYNFYPSKKPYHSGSHFALDTF